MHGFPFHRIRGYVRGFLAEGDMQAKPEEKLYRNSLHPWRCSESYPENPDFIKQRQPGFGVFFTSFDVNFW